MALTRATLQTLQDTFRIDALPKTFRDAIYVLGSLGSATSGLIHFASFRMTRPTGKLSPSKWARYMSGDTAISLLPAR